MADSEGKRAQRDETAQCTGSCSFLCTSLALYFLNTDTTLQNYILSKRLFNKLENTWRFHLFHIQLFKRQQLQMPTRAKQKCVWYSSKGGKKVRKSNCISSRHVEASSLYLKWIPIQNKSSNINTKTFPKPKIAKFMFENQL